MTRQRRCHGTIAGMADPVLLRAGAWDEVTARSAHAVALATGSLINHRCRVCQQIRNLAG